MLLITFLSHVPQDNIPNVGLDKIDIPFHFVEYSFLGFLLFRSIFLDKSLIVHPFYGSLLIGMSFAILDEFHQSFVPGRYMSSVDMFFDSIGILFGTMISSQRFNSS
jgi:VanZ family protein